ncbi:MAG: hypothetical protein WCA49_11240 [Candidatus Sulfotelmatobacter sp.]
MQTIRAQRQQIEEASEDQFLASWEWDRMLFCLGEECDRFNADACIKSLEPAPVLRLEHLRPLWSRLTYSRGNTRHVMHVTYSVPLQCCAFQMHGQPAVYKHYLIVRDGKAYFRAFQSREEAARRILCVFFSETTDQRTSVQ